MFVAAVEETTAQLVLTKTVEEVGITAAEALAETEERLGPEPLLNQYHLRSSSFSRRSQPLVQERHLCQCEGLERQRVLDPVPRRAKGPEHPKPHRKH